MCATCGCADGARARHQHDDGTWHTHDAAGHERQHEHADGQTVTLEEKVLARNDALAAQNRDWLRARRVLALNLMSSPGAGKTTLLERTASDLAGELVIGVIEGDQETALDADRMRAAGCKVVQVNTGTGCHLDAAMVREALTALPFYVHADLFMNPTAELADVVLPVATPFEREGLKIGFDVSPEAQSLVQLRRRLIEPRGEARSDTEIVFELARRLGLGDRFWDGDIEAAQRHQLAPSGLTLEALRASPAGLRVALRVRYRKYAEEKEGVPAGFATPSRKIELYSETLLEHGYPPLPDYEEPLVSPSSRPDLTPRYPLILTCAKSTQFCESQHRGLPSLRRRAPDPEVELHPTTAAARGIRAGDWVSVITQEGRVRARAQMNESLDPRVVCGQHGWWQGCPEIGAPAYDPFGPEGANLNLIVGNAAIDPVSGSVPHRAYLCEIRRVD